MLKINDIHVNYGYSEALRGVNIHINEGEIVALLGNNGAGKTTTVNTVSGITNLVSGNIEFQGEDITKLPAYDRVKRGIVQVPEGRKLFPYLSVYENLLIGSYLPELRAKRKENLEMCFEIFPKLYERKNQLANSLSGGEQQMCAIARGLMQNPKILMLDEPSLGLAPVIVDGIFKTLKKINEQGTTIFLIEQNVQSSLEIADRAYIIEIGQDVMNGTSAELLANEELKKAYLGI